MQCQRHIQAAGGHLHDAVHSRAWGVRSRSEAHSIYSQLKPGLASLPAQHPAHSSNTPHTQSQQQQQPRFQKPSGGGSKAQRVAWLHAESEARKIKQEKALKDVPSSVRHIQGPCVSGTSFIKCRTATDSTSCRLVTAAFCCLPDCRSTLPLCKRFAANF